MSSSCDFDGCTVDDTGVCALDRDPLTCSNRTIDETVGTSLSDAQTDEDIKSQPDDRLGAAVLVQPKGDSAFPSSRTLGLDELNVLMGTRYVNVVGILGDPESGKTACLASLYLLVSHAQLRGYSFADSKSLAAFEEIARGARDWNEGEVPEQMTVHTELTDDHRPGFLHLKLVRLSDGRRFELALPDVPGEWTQALVNSAQADRFEFMKSADAIWIVLDGRMLADLEKRNGLISRLGQLVQRLNTMFNGRVPRLLLVVTHHDMHTISDRVTELIHIELERRRARAEIVSVAPFSNDSDSVPAGFGIQELIDLTVKSTSERPTLWPSTEPIEGDRTYMSYRRKR